MGLLRRCLQELRSKQSAGQAGAGLIHEPVIGVRDAEAPCPVAFSEHELPARAAKKMEGDDDRDYRA